LSANAAPRPQPYLTILFWILCFFAGGVLLYRLVEPADKLDRLTFLFALALGAFTLLRWRAESRLETLARGEQEHVKQELMSKTAELQRIDDELSRREEERRQAEMSYRMLAKAVETMSLGVTITDARGRILYVNPADARQHGYEVEELIGRDARIFSSGLIPGPELTSDEPWARERINTTKQGDLFPVRLVSDRVRSEAGETVATVTICEDIREHIRAREALERRDRVLEAVGLAAERFLAESSWSENVEEVIARLGAVTRADRIVLEIADFSVAPNISGFTYQWPGIDGSTTSLKIRQVSDGRPWADEYVLPERWLNLLKAGGVVHGPWTQLSDDERKGLRGDEISSFVVVPLFAHKTWRGFLAFESSEPQRDWSVAEIEALRTAARTLGAAVQRHEDEKALAASETKFRELLEGAHDLVQSIGPEGQFLFVNRAWKETLGYDDLEIAALRVGDVVRSLALDGRRDMFELMFSENGPSSIEAIFVTKDGRELTVEGNITRRRIDNRTVAAQGIFRDITERKQIDRMKQEFLSTVSHELRTPLTSIVASLGLLASGRLEGQNERIQQLIAVAHRNSDRLMKLIEDLLDLQKLAARKMNFRSDVLEVRGLLEEAIRSLQAFAESFQVELRLGTVEAEKVVADRDRLMQVLHNLISNAIKFSPPREVVTLFSKLRGERIVIFVADQGPGIPDDFRTRLFEPFTQADPSTTRAAGGSGLGLSIAKGLAEGMRGTIGLESSLGEGTTFFVELPGIEIVS
jgi:PAS domain S-box-containing protein